ncbi:MAG: CHASE2 domain-containing protein [Xanthobacteraceae bacterium]
MSENLTVPASTSTGRRSVRVGRLYLPFVALFLLIAVIGRWYDPFFVQAMRLVAFDTYQRLSPESYDPALPVRVVDIDLESLKRLGQWPWPRSRMRDMVERLKQRGAAAIAFDVLFGEPDQNSIEEMVKRLPPAQAEKLADAAGGVTNDQAFAQAMANAPVALGVVLNHQPGTAPFQPKAGFAVAGDDPKSRLPDFSGVDHNLPVLEAAAPGLGAVNWIPNRDQVVRRVPMYLRVGDTIVPSLAAEALRLAQGASTHILKSSNASGETAFGQNTGLNNARIGDVVFPLDRDGAVTLRFRPKNPAAFVPAWKVLSGEARPDDIAGKIIFVGTSVPGLLDLRATPLDAELSGVELHAMALEHILSGRQLTRPDYALALEQFAIVVFGLLLAVIMPRLSPVGAALLGVAVFAAINIDGWIAFRYWDLLFDPLYPSLTLLVLTASITFYIYRQTEAQRGAIRGAFGRYLAPAVVEEIISDPSRLELGGEVRELSLMFCDVRNFTGISEGMSAAALTLFINELLTPLSDIILRQRGTIDKYMGDAIMAFWNAPLPLADHPARACRAAVEMVREMDVLNAKWQARALADGKSFSQVRIGIGINTGECCVGNLGSEQRFDYSAIGDDVNLTSRLEGLTKLYGLTVVVGERTAEKLPADSVVELDLIKVKGRSQPTRIYTLSELLDRDAAGLARLRALQDEFLFAYRGQRWEEAEAALTRCDSENCAALKSYYAVFASRIAALRGAGLAAGWDGTFAMTEK